MVDISYQNIPYPLLHDYLGEVESTVITDLIAKHGWQVKSEKGEGQGEGAEQEEEHKVVLIKNQEATIRPKKILAKIEFDSKLIKGQPSGEINCANSASILYENFLQQKRENQLVVFCCELLQGSKFQALYIVSARVEAPQPSRSLVLRPRHFISSSVQ